MDRLTLKWSLAASGCLGLLLVAGGCRNRDLRVPPVTQYSSDGMATAPAAQPYTSYGDPAAAPTTPSGYNEYQAGGAYGDDAGYDPAAAPGADPYGQGGVDPYGATSADPYGGSGLENDGGYGADPYAQDPGAGMAVPDLGAAAPPDGMPVEGGATPSIPEDLPAMPPVPGA